MINQPPITNVGDGISEPPNTGIGGGVSNPVGGSPSYVDSDIENNGAGSSTTVTSKSFNVSAGDLIVLMCTGGNVGLTFSITSSQGDTVSGSLTLQNLPGAVGIDQGFYILSAVGGPTTFTCHSSGSQTFQGIGVAQYHKGTISALDVAAPNVTGGNATYTTGTFTTTAAAGSPSLIVVFGQAGFAATLSGGSIGSIATNTRQTGGGPVIEDAITTGPNTSITGTVHASISGNWGGFYMAFK